MTCKTVNSMGAALLLHDLARAEGHIKGNLCSASKAAKQWAFFPADLSEKFGDSNLGAIKVGSFDFMLCFHFLWFCVFTGNCYICHFKLLPNPGILIN